MAMQQVRHQAGDVVRDMRSWLKRSNDAAMRRMASRYERPRPARWPLVGMLALGLVAGAALGGYAVSQRWRLKRLSEYARRWRDRQLEMDAREGDAATVDVAPLSGDRRNSPAVQAGDVHAS